MLTYTLNKVVKTFQIALVLSLGLLAFGVFVTTPRHVLLLLFANDFVTMSLAADRVTAGRKPARWHLRLLVAGALVIAFAWLVFTFAVFLLGRDWLHLDLPRLQTLVFLTLVFTGQATVYLVRERRHFWDSLPGGWLLLSSLADFVVVGLLASFGILIAPVPPTLIFGLVGLVAVSFVVLDVLKRPLFRRLDLD